jgi:hypothetical protein
MFFCLPWRFLLSLLCWGGPIKVSRQAQATQEPLPRKAGVPALACSCLRAWYLFLLMANSRWTDGEGNYANFTFCALMKWGLIESRQVK